MSIVRIHRSVKNEAILNDLKYYGEMNEQNSFTCFDVMDDQ